MAAMAALLTALVLALPWLLLLAALALLLFLRSLGRLRVLCLTGGTVHRLAWGEFTPEALGRFLGWMMVIAFAVNLAVAFGVYAAAYQPTVFSLAGPLLVQLQTLLYSLADIGGQGFFSTLVVVAMTLSVYWICFLLLALIGNGPVFYYSLSTTAFKGCIAIVLAAGILLAGNALMHSDYAISQGHRGIFHRLMSYDDDGGASLITAFGTTFFSTLGVPLFVFLLCFVVPRIILERRTGRSPEADLQG